MEPREHLSREQLNRKWNADLYDQAIKMKISNVKEKIFELDTVEFKKWLVSEILNKQGECSIYEKIKEVKVLNLKKGDVLVLRHQEQLTMKAAENIHRSIESIFGEGVKCMILEEGMDVEIVRREDNGEE